MTLGTEEGRSWWPEPKNRKFTVRTRQRDHHLGHSLVRGRCFFFFFIVDKRENENRQRHLGVSLPWLLSRTERKSKEEGRLAIARDMEAEKTAKIVGESCQLKRLCCGRRRAG